MPSFVGAAINIEENQRNGYSGEEASYVSDYKVNHREKFSHNPNPSLLLLHCALRR